MLKKFHARRCVWWLWFRGNVRVSSPGRLRLCRLLCVPQRGRGQPRKLTAEARQRVDVPGAVVEGRRCNGPRRCSGRRRGRCRLMHRRPSPSHLFPAPSNAVAPSAGSPGAQLLYADANGWASGWTWSQRSECQYADNFLPNARLAAAAKAAGAQRFVYVGVSSEAEKGFGGPNPGLYTGKRSAALAALEEFGSQHFTYFGPARVVGSKENWRARAANSRFINGLRALVDVIGEIRSFGPDYTTKARRASAPAHSTGCPPRRHPSLGALQAHAAGACRRPRARHCWRCDRQGRG